MSEEFRFQGYTADELIRIIDFWKARQAINPVVDEFESDGENMSKTEQLNADIYDKLKTAKAVRINHSQAAKLLNKEVKREWDVFPPPEFTYKKEFEDYCKSNGLSCKFVKDKDSIYLENI